MNDSYRPDLTAARLERAVAALDAPRHTVPANLGSYPQDADHSWNVLASTTLARRYRYSVSLGQPEETLAVRVQAALAADPDGMAAYLSQHPESCRTLVEALESASLRDRVEAGSPHVVVPFAQAMSSGRTAAATGHDSLA